MTFKDFREKPLIRKKTRRKCVKKCTMMMSKGKCGRKCEGP
jgi:hypothetical protein